MVVAHAAAPVAGIGRLLLRLRLRLRRRAGGGLESGVDAGDAAGAEAEQRGAGEDDERRGDPSHELCGHARKQSGAAQG